MVEGGVLSEPSINVAITIFDVAMKLEGTMTTLDEIEPIANTIDELRAKVHADTISKISHPRIPLFNPNSLNWAMIVIATVGSGVNVFK